MQPRYLLPLVAVLLALLTACTDVGGPDQPTLAAKLSVASVAVTPSTATLVSLGETVQLAASAQDASGNTISGKTFTWSSSDASIATVSATGLVTAVANGSATITATADAVNGTAAIVVDQSVASVVVTPSTATLVSLGETVQLTASARVASGTSISVKTFTWSSSDVSIATVSSSGLATAIANGAATITATTEGVQGSASLTVSLPAAFQVAISATVTSKGFNATTNREECRYTVTAVASGGSSAEYALWTTYDWEFRHPDGTVQTINATQSETVDFWGSDRLVTGTSRTANRIAWHPSKKFTLFYTFRYTLNATGEQRTGSLSIDCI